MIVVPGWISNSLFLVNCAVSGYQHVWLRRPNPVTNTQFLMILFAMAMVVIIATHAQTDPWLSLGFFVIAAFCLGFMIRQNRTLPSRTFE